MRTPVSGALFFVRSCFPFSQHAHDCADRRPFFLFVLFSLFRPSLLLSVPSTVFFLRSDRQASYRIRHVHLSFSSPGLSFFLSPRAEVTAHCLARQLDAFHGASVPLSDALFPLQDGEITRDFLLVEPFFLIFRLSLFFISA